MEENETLSSTSLLRILCKGVIGEVVCLPEIQRCSDLS